MPGTEASAGSEAVPPAPPGSSGGPQADVPCGGQPDGAALLREIDRLRTLLAGHAAGRDGLAPPAGDELLVIARFAPGITLEAWNALIREESAGIAGACEAPDPAGTGAPGARSEEGAWFALALDPVRHPQLLGLFRRGTPLFGLVCPLTGALLPAAFRRQIAAEIERVRTGDSEMTLVLFELAGAVSERRAPSPVPQPDPLTLPEPSEPSEPAHPAHPAPSAGPAARPGRAPDPAALTDAPFPPSALDDSLSALARLVRAHARATDVPGRLAWDRLAVLMPGVGPFRARALTERLMAAFREEADTPEAAALLRAGLACCDSETLLPADVLLGQASMALALARPGFTRTFRKAGAPEPERRTQVQACEKAFLFFGDTE